MGLSGLWEAGPQDSEICCSEHEGEPFASHDQGEITFFVDRHFQTVRSDEVHSAITVKSDLACISVAALQEVDCESAAAEAVQLYASGDVGNREERTYYMNGNLSGLVDALINRLGFRLRFGLRFGLGFRLRFGLGFRLRFRLRFRLGFRIGFGCRLGFGIGLGYRLGFGIGLGLGFRLGFGFRLNIILQDYGEEHAAAARNDHEIVAVAVLDQP